MDCLDGSLYCAIWLLSCVCAPPMSGFHSLHPSLPFLSLATSLWQSYDLSPRANSLSLPLSRSPFWPRFRESLDKSLSIRFVCMSTNSSYQRGAYALVFPAKQGDRRPQSSRRSHSVTRLGHDVLWSPSSRKATIHKSFFSRHFKETLFGQWLFFDDLHKFRSNSLGQTRKFN